MFRSFSFSQAICPLIAMACLAVLADDARGQWARNTSLPSNRTGQVSPPLADAASEVPKVPLGPNSSLWRQENTSASGVTRPLVLGDSSPFYREVTPPRTIGLHSIITIRVTERSELLSEGSIENRGTIDYEAKLEDWIQLVGLKAVVPDPQTKGDPKIKGNLKQNYRVESELETGNVLEFTIAAQVVDIRPNGNLVLEAHKTVQDNEEIWDYSLTGICRKEDVQAGNEVLSSDVADLSIHKRERGQVRDAYRRGWFTRLYDRFDPF